jgi:TonB family protein
VPQVGETLRHNQKRARKLRSYRALLFSTKKVHACQQNSALYIPPPLAYQKASQSDFAPSKKECNSGKELNPSMRRLLVAVTLVALLLPPEPLGARSIPAVKVAVAPSYPSVTLAGRIYGDVTVSVAINRAGTVEGAAVLDGHPMLREAALSAARQWQFARSSLASRKATLTFRFVILSEDSEVKSETLFLPPAGYEIRERPEPASLMEDQQGEAGPSRDPVSLTWLQQDNAPPPAPTA